MEEYRAVADQAMNTIEEHYPEFLRMINREDTIVEKLGYFIAAQKLVHDDPLSDARSQAILEAKLSRRIHKLKAELRRDVQKRIEVDIRATAHMN